MEDDQLRRALRASKPSQLRVHTTDRDEPELLKVSAKRTRWAEAVDTLATMNWYRVDCLDKDGAVVGPPVIDEDAEPEPEAVFPQSESGELATIIINAQRLALENQRDMLQPLVDGYVQLGNMLHERLSSMERHFDKTLSIAYENALLQAQLDGGGTSGADQLAAMMMQRMMEGKDKSKQLNGKAPKKGGAK